MVLEPPHNPVTILEVAEVEASGEEGVVEAVVAASEDADVVAAEAEAEDGAVTVATAIVIGIVIMEVFYSLNLTNFYSLNSHYFLRFQPFELSGLKLSFLNFIDLEVTARAGTTATEEVYPYLVLQLDFGKYRAR